MTRSAICKRKTLETRVTVELNLGEPMAALGLALALLYWAMAQTSEGTVF